MMRIYSRLLVHAMRGQGEMWTADIYRSVRQEARRQRWPLPKHWKATVRNTLQRHSRQSRKYQRPNLFRHHERGLWELR